MELIAPGCGLAGNINSVTKGLDKSRDDSSIHGLGGEEAVWGLLVGGESLSAVSWPPSEHFTGFRPQGPQVAVSVLLRAGAPPEFSGSFLNPRHSPSAVWRDSGTMSSPGEPWPGCPLRDQQGETDTVSSPAPRTEPGYSAR